jgi:hypothetical protein
VLVGYRTLENWRERSDLVLADRPGHTKMVLGPMVSCVILAAARPVPRHSHAVTSKMSTCRSQLRLRREPVEIAWEQPRLPDVRRVHETRHPAL